VKQGVRCSPSANPLSYNAIRGILQGCVGRGERTRLSVGP
jgi:hypothetical protein